LVGRDSFQFASWFVVTYGFSFKNKGKLWSDNRSYVEIVIGSNEREEDKKLHKEYHRENPPPGRFRFQNQ
jgi:hypothetical protein